MKKKKQNKTVKQTTSELRSGEQLDVNGNPIDPKRKYLGKRLKVPFLSADSDFYKNNSTIILFGGKRNVNSEETPKSKFEKFLSRAPISFNDEEEV
jgi:hypothetical protein